MAQASAAPVLHQTNSQLEEQKQDPEPQQQPHSLHPYVQTIGSVSSGSSDSMNDDDDDDDDLLDELCESCLETLFSPSSCYSESEYDQGSGLNCFHDDDDELLAELCDSCLETPFSPSICYSESEFDPGSGLNCFHDEYEEDDQVDLVIDLFASGEESSLENCQNSDEAAFTEAVSDISLCASEGSGGTGSDNGEEGLVGVVIASGSGESSPVRCRDSGWDGREASWSGLLVVGIESESDSEFVDQEAVSGIDDDGVDRLGELGDPMFWDCLGFEEQMPNSEELEWEEVEERFDEREGLRSVIDRIEELSMSSNVSRHEETNDAGEEIAQSLEWQVLMAINNLDLAHMFGHEAGDEDDDLYLAVQDDYMYGGEFNTVFEQFVHNNGGMRRSPPAAKYVRENLPSVTLTKEELQQKNMVCAVCKDGIVVDEKVTVLPCHHHYHWDCILPWLNVSNTCPVCRHELPTDDVEYEQRRTQESGLGLGQDFEVRYNYERFP